MKTTINKLFTSKKMKFMAAYAICKHFIDITKGEVDPDVIMDSECIINESNISGCFTLTFDIKDNFYAIRIEQDDILLTKEEYLTI